MIWSPLMRITPPQHREHSSHGELRGGTTVCYIRCGRIIPPNIVTIGVLWFSPTETSTEARALRYPFRGCNSSTVGVACHGIRINLNFRFPFSLLATHNSRIDSVIEPIG